MTKIIKLTKGKTTVVDDEDYEWLSQWKWLANRNNRNHEKFYAMRYAPRIEGMCRPAIYMARERSSTLLLSESVLSTGRC